MRTTFSQLRQSRFPRVLGFCQGDLPEILEACNEAQQRLINEASEYGWWGGWAKVAFTAQMANPYVTLPPEFARAIGFDVCRTPIRIQNSFYEILDAGIGLRGPNNCVDRCGPMESYDRGSFPTAIDLTPSNQLLRVYPTDPSDVGKSVMISNAKDQNGTGIYTTAASGQVNGFIMELNEPFTDSPFIVTSFGQVSKDVTNGDVILKQVDATSGVEVTLSRYTPQEQNPAYRRYYFSRLPFGCCNNGPVSGPVVITCMAKYEFIPVQTDTDFLIIGNIPALIEEGQALNYSTMESPQAIALEIKHHRKATTLLQQEITHYLGTIMPAVNFAPYGTAKLEHTKINMV